MRARHIGVRIAALATAAWFCTLENNPAVIFLARTGLSPSPLERLGLKGLFSGMTEGMYQLTHGHFSAALSANPYTPVVAVTFAFFVLSGVRPRITRKWQEAAFLGSALALTFARNIPSTVG